MRCAAVQSRLVAWQDEELSPGEHVRVTEHLESCADCRAAEARLIPVDLSDALEIPPELAARLAAATQVDHLLAEAERADRRSPFPPAPWYRRWTTEVVEVPSWMLLAAAATLFLTAGWAVQMTWAYESSMAETQALIAERAEPNAEPLEVSPIDLPADQFQPASYQPGEEQGYR